VLRLHACRQSLVVEEKQNVTLSVSVEANPTPEITWTFGGQRVEVENDERFTLTPDGSLTISSLRLSDSGLYTVAADNGLGATARDTLDLRVYPSQMPVEVGRTIPSVHSRFSVLVCILWLR
jgi:hypothetical protein